MTPDEFKRRTFNYGVRIVRVVQTLPKTDVARELGKQLLRAGTSVGANYRAAARARTRLEFVAKLGIVEEECDESLYWLELLVELDLVQRARIDSLEAEGAEILAMTVASIKTARHRPRELRMRRSKTKKKSAQSSPRKPKPSRRAARFH